MTTLEMTSIIPGTLESLRPFLEGRQLHIQYPSNKPVIVQGEISNYILNNKRKLDILFRWSAVYTGEIPARGLPTQGWIKSASRTAIFNLSTMHVFTPDGTFLVLKQPKAGVIAFAIPKGHSRFLEQTNIQGFGETG